MKVGVVVLNNVNFRSGIAALLVLLFLGALFWAKGRDPFERVWFTVKAAEHGKAKCIAVLPKMAARPLPVVIYLHGSGGSLLGSGNELRQMAEMGLAAIGMEYNRTNEPAFEAQFSALLNFVQRQRWADTSRTAWVGFSLGANRSLAFALKHPEARPGLLVRISGGWIPELEGTEGGSRKPETSPSTLNQQPSTVLVVHGEQDAVFPIADARRVAAALATNGFRVELQAFPGQSHGFDPNRLVLFRGVAEYCMTQLKGAEAFKKYESILSWQQRAWPLWLFWLPALLWVIAWWYARRTPHPVPLPIGWGEGVRRASEGPGSAGILAGALQFENPAGKGARAAAGKDACAPRFSRWEIALRWMAGILALLALGQTALHLVPPRFAITSRTLEIARAHLVQPKEIPDFDCLSTNGFWQGKRLKTLLEHVELAHYNRELVNWKLDDDIYRQFVLSSQVEPARDGDMNWRRALWESFYPRIRKENDLAAAADIIVRHLRERVTVVSKDELPKPIARIWTEQLTDEGGFATLYVAALRSAGVPARLNGKGEAECYTGTEWKPAPLSAIESLIR